MKTNVKQYSAEKPQFHAVDFFRDVKAQISNETREMSFEEFKQYINAKLKRNRVRRL
ncbi:MAG TPA: hypothetical protein VG537_00290 [Candidatus Kapabacteria bacterium]|jgi:hypothetical protein|nr:hypothetical protein [Candidatus Kapabacteria bacterium]